MKFCAKLLKEINFEPGAISPCCQTRNVKIPAFPYSGGEINLQAYASHIENVLTQIQQDGPVCRNCPELQEAADLPPSNGKFRAVSINMHRYFCNCKCVYCSLWQNPQKGRGYDILPGLQSLESQHALEKHCFFSWGGGEPSILPQFDETSAWIQDKGFYQNIHTNALRYSPAIANLLANNKGQINISLDSASASVYKAVKGVDGFNKVHENLQKYATAGADNVILKYIVFEKNNSPKEILGFLDLAKELGVKTLEISLNFLEINANKVSDKTLMATAMLYLKAMEMGFPNVQPFFIDPVWQRKINEKIKLFQQ